MNINRISHIIALLCLILAMSTHTEAGEKEYNPLTVTDPVSGTEIIFDKAVKTDSSDIEFQKAFVLTPHSCVSVYSMPNPDDKTFTWQRVNEFDANNKYGTLVKKEKLTNADGWIRYYNSTDKKGRQVINCITLVRGNAYALYLYETAYDIADCVTPSIAQATDFGRVKGRRIENDGSLTATFWVFTAIALLLAAPVKWIFGKDIDTPIVVTALIIVIAYALGLFFWLHYGIGSTILWSVVIGSFWTGVCLSSSWSEFFDFIQKAIEKAG